MSTMKNTTIQFAGLRGSPLCLAAVAAATTFAFLLLPWLAWAQQSPNQTVSAYAGQTISSVDVAGRPDVVAELTNGDDRWTFANFHYGKSAYSEDENLLATLKTLQRDRQTHSK